MSRVEQRLGFLSFKLFYRHPLFVCNSIRSKKKAWDFVTWAIMINARLVDDAITIRDADRPRIRDMHSWFFWKNCSIEDRRIFEKIVLELEFFSDVKILFHWRANNCTFFIRHFINFTYKFMMNLWWICCKNLNFFINNHCFFDKITIFYKWLL